MPDRQTIRRRYWLRLARRACVAALIAVAIVGWTRGHWWLRLPVVDATKGGSPLECSMWRSLDGSLLLQLRDSVDYIVNPTCETVCVPNARRLRHAGIAGFTVESPAVPCVRMPSAKIEQEPSLRMGDGRLSFVAMDGDAISVTYRTLEGAW